MKLGIQPLLPTGNFLNKRYSIEIDFPDDSSPLENFKYLNEVVTATHMAEFPQCYKDGKPLFISYQGDEETNTRVIEKPKEKLSPLDQTIADIESCKELKVLESYRLIVKNEPKLQTIYDNQYKKLTNG